MNKKDVIIISKDVIDECLADSIEKADEQKQVSHYKM